MPTSISKKIIMALSGAFLGGYLVVHAIGNATAFFGRETFLSYARHLHSLGIIIPIFEFSLLAVFCLHVLFGINLYLENRRARPQGYLVQKNAGGRTWGSMSMPYTGAIIFIFIIVHLRDFHFVEPGLAINEIMGNRLRQLGPALFYIAAIAALFLHIRHGFWSLLQTLGLNYPKYNPLLRKVTLIITIMICAVFILIPISFLVIDGFLQ